MGKKSKSSEFRAYPWILSKLKLKDWNCSNPNRNPKGEVWTQNECLSHLDIKKALGALKPENVVKVLPDKFWIIEAKNGPINIDRASKEAKEYADIINNNSTLIAAPFASGVAGSEEDGFEIKTFFKSKSGWKQVHLGKQPLSRMLSKSEALRILSTENHNLERPELTMNEVITLSNEINEILHISKVEKEDRASYVAILLLTIHEDPNLSHTGNAKLFINDINSRAKQIFTKCNKEQLWDVIAIKPTSETLESQATALNTIINLLRDADILYAVKQTDILGSFFESFLRYGNTSKELGIVLTPRHICWLAAETMDINSSDLVFDPAVGTGGFLIAAFNKIKKIIPDNQAKDFAAKNLFGIEAQGRVASLAFINMYFRGDGKHNLKIDSCFNWRLAGKSKASKFPQYEESAKEDKKTNVLISKVMMNPPFSLKDDKQKEPDFIDFGLRQLTDNGLLFAVLPSSVLYDKKNHKWRKWLLTKHTIKAVVLFPVDLFYPVATETVGLYIKKGTPHDENTEVLWARITDDGFIKKKGFRVEKKGLSYQDDLKKYSQIIKLWVTQDTKLPDIPGVIEFNVLQTDEIIPQAHLGTPKLDPILFKKEVKRSLNSLSSQLWEQKEELNS